MIIQCLLLKLNRTILAFVPDYRLKFTETCLLIKSVQNKTRGTEALLHSINESTTVRTTIVNRTGHIS